MYQGVTKRCRLSWLTNSAHVYGPKCCCAHGAQINFRDLTSMVGRLGAEDGDNEIEI